MSARDSQLDNPVPAGTYSLNSLGAQGAHPGDSGILGLGRFDKAAFDNLIGRARNGAVKRSDFAKFIAENLKRDPASKVFGKKVARAFGHDLVTFVNDVGPALLDKLNLGRGDRTSVAHRETLELLTRFLSEDNLVGSAGEWGLLFAFLDNKPLARVDGEPAITVQDLTLMFKDKRFPPGWETWPKWSSDWVRHTSALMVEAGKAYLKG